MHGETHSREGDRDTGRVEERQTSEGTQERKREGVRGDKRARGGHMTGW